MRQPRPEGTVAPGLLRFHPILKKKVWGGRSLETCLGRKLPGAGPFGESWDIADHGTDRSVVSGGPWDGRDLHELAIREAQTVFGRAPDRAAGGFPLLLKSIDAREPLSVQVHPGDEDAARLGHGLRGKSEAWVILDAGAEARIVYGLIPGADREDVLRSAEAGDWGNVERLLKWCSVKRGDVVFLPAGTIHAIGEGILLLEVQQTSDMTYRIHDWGRLGLDGRPRELHIREARGVLARPPEHPCPCASMEALRSGREVLIECRHFRMEAIRLSAERSRLALSTHEPPAAGFRILAGYEGRARVSAGSDGAVTEIGPGDFVLVPSATGDVTVEASAGPFKGLLVGEGE